MYNVTRMLDYKAESSGNVRIRYLMIKSHQISIPQGLIGTPLKVQVHVHTFNIFDPPNHFLAVQKLSTFGNSPKLAGPPAWKRSSWRRLSPAWRIKSWMTEDPPVIQRGIWDDHGWWTSAGKKKIVPGKTGENSHDSQHLHLNYGSFCWWSLALFDSIRWQVEWGSYLVWLHSWAKNILFQWYALVADLVDSGFFKNTSRHIPAS